MNKTSKASQHTKGPWKMNAGTIMANDGVNPVAVVNPECGNEKWIQDAFLIAAAPELLEALKAGLQRLIELQNATGYPTALIQIQFEDAIAKAEGRDE